MLRSLNSRTTLSKEQMYSSSQEEKQPKEEPQLNYCPLPTANPKKEEIDRLLKEYDQLHKRMHQVRSRLKQLGFSSN
jgi:hypothetical protein